MIKIVVFGLAVFVGAVLLVIVIGYLLPKGHRASCSANFPHSPETLWQVVANRAASSWRSDVTQVELLSSAGDEWKETNAGGDVISFRIEESDPPRRMVTRIADKTLPFGGSWTYQLERDETTTRVTITEDGEVYNPIFRFVSHFFMNSSATIKTYLRDLGQHLGSAVDIDCQR